MTGTPNLLCVSAVLNDAFEMSADGRECLELSGARANQNARFIAELEDLARIDRDFAQFGRND